MHFNAVFALLITMSGHSTLIRWASSLHVVRRRTSQPVLHASRSISTNSTELHGGMVLSSCKTSSHAGARRVNAPRMKSQLIRADCNSSSVIRRVGGKPSTVGENASTVRSAELTCGGGLVKSIATLVRRKFSEMHVESEKQMEILPFDTPAASKCRGSLPHTVRETSCGHSVRAAKSVSRRWGSQVPNHKWVSRGVETASGF
jgi:hypothetical protein